LVRPSCDVVRPAGADGLDGSDDHLLLLVADALDCVIHLLRSRSAAARGIDSQNNGLHRRVVTIFLELVDKGFCLENYTLNIQDGDLVAADVESGVITANAEIEQRKDKQSKDEEGSASDHNPQERARTILVRHMRKV